MIFALLAIFFVRDHSFNIYAKFFKKTKLSYPLIQMRTCANQWVIAWIDFWEIFGTYLMNNPFLDVYNDIYFPTSFMKNSCSVFPFFWFRG